MSVRQVFRALPKPDKRPRVPELSMFKVSDFKLEKIIKFQSYAFRANLGRPKLPKLGFVSVTNVTSPKPTIG